MLPWCYGALIKRPLASTIEHATRQSREQGNWPLDSQNEVGLFFYIWAMILGRWLMRSGRVMPVSR